MRTNNIRSFFNLPRAGICYRGKGGGGELTSPLQNQIREALQLTKGNSAMLTPAVVMEIHQSVSVLLPEARFSAKETAGALGALIT